MPGRDLFANEPKGRDLFAEPVGEPDYFGSGVIEPATTFGSALVAEPAAGITGLAGMGVNELFNFFRNKNNQVDSSRLGEQMMSDTREALTYQPKTVSGIQNMQDIGETLAPVAEAIQATEKFTGDIGYELGGESPVMGAIGTTLPTAAITALGLKPFRDAAKAATGFNRVQKSFREASEGRQVNKALLDGAPSIDSLKSQSRSIFKNLDESGAVISADKITPVINDIEKTLFKKGFHPKLQSSVNVALDELRLSAGKDVPIQRVNTLREFAQASASDMNSKTKMLGVTILNKLDDMMDGLEQGDFIKGGGNIGEQNRLARDLWGRGRKSELIEDAISMAENQASGLENGLRIQLRRIVDSKRDSRFFSADEIKEMRKVINGAKGANAAKLFGKFGFGLDKASNMLGGSIGGASGYAIGGVPGFIAVTGLGTVSRKLAEVLTRNNSELADAVIRAGKNGRKITKEYLAKVPKKERTPQMLAELLSNSKSSLEKLRKMPLTSLPKEQKILIKDAILYADMMRQGQSEPNPSQKSKSSSSSK